MCRMSRSASFAALFVTLSAGGAPTPVPLDDYTDVAVEEGCKLIFECCPEGMRGTLTDLPTCEAALRDIAGDGSALRSAVEAGRIRWDAEAAGECLAAGTCGERPEACGRVRVPLVELGGTCSGNSECISGACALGTSVCVAPLAEGMVCDGTVGCEEGLRCDETGTCIRALANGEPCTSLIECQSGICEGTCRAYRVDSICAPSP